MGFTRPQAPAELSLAFFRLGKNSFTDTPKQPWLTPTVLALLGLLMAAALVLL